MVKEIKKNRIYNKLFQNLEKEQYDNKIMYFITNGFDIPHPVVFFIADFHINTIFIKIKTFEFVVGYELDEDEIIKIIDDKFNPFKFKIEIKYHKYD